MTFFNDTEQQTGGDPATGTTKQNLEEVPCLDLDTGAALNDGIPFTAAPLREHEFWPVLFHQVLDTERFREIPYNEAQILVDLIPMTEPGNWLVIDERKLRNFDPASPWINPASVNAAVDELKDFRIFVDASEGPSLPDVIRNDAGRILRLNPFYFWRGSSNKLEKARAWWLETTR